MKKALYLALGMLFASSAFAQQNTPPAGAPGQERPQDFQQMKQRLLERMGRRIDAIQKAKSCVQQAQDAQALRSCRPSEPRRGGPDGRGQPR
jgi:hypothetical protein